MHADNRTAKVVGALFVFATVAAMISTTISDQLFQRADYLPAANQNQVLLVVALSLFYLMEASVVAIAVLLYPVLKNHGEELAIGYIVARAAEGVLGVVSRTMFLTIIFLSERFVAADVTQQVGIQITADAASSFADGLFTVSSIFFFGISALLLNQLLFKSKLVPDFISIWGWIGGVLLLVAVTLHVFGISFPGMEAALILPIAINEMVLAGWLIIKGFQTA